MILRALFRAIFTPRFPDLKKNKKNALWPKERELRCVTEYCLLLCFLGTDLWVLPGTHIGVPIERILEVPIIMGTCRYPSKVETSSPGVRWTYPR